MGMDRKQTIQRLLREASEVLSSEHQAAPSTKSKDSAEAILEELGDSDIPDTVEEIAEGLRSVESTEEEGDAVAELLEMKKVSLKLAAMIDKFLAAR